MAEVTGYCRNWIHILLRRYNQQGPQALVDHRHANAGPASLLSPEQQAHLAEDLNAPQASGGLWTGRKVAGWIQTQTGRQVHPQRGWAYLKRLRESSRVLRPRHAKADPAAQAEFKKTSPSA